MSRVVLTIGHQSFLLPSSAGAATIIATLSKVAEIRYERHEGNVTVYRVEDPPRVEIEPVTSRMRFVSKRPCNGGAHHHHSAAPLQPDEDEVTFIDPKAVKPKPAKAKALTGPKLPAPKNVIALPAHKPKALPPPARKALPPQRTFFLE